MKVEELEKLAGTIGLLIKIQVRETLGLCFFRIVIAEQKDNIIKIWAEMKGWTYLNKKGIQLGFRKRLLLDLSCMWNANFS